MNKTQKSKVDTLGIILVAGKGTRMYPMTHYVSKALLPVYDKPAIYYSLALLNSCGVRNVVIICNEKELDSYSKFLGNGSGFGMKITYRVQENQIGIPNALSICEDLIKNRRVILMLGDNIFLGKEIQGALEDAIYKHLPCTASMFYIDVKDPERFGIVEFNEMDDPKTIIEKPKNFVSNSAVVGLYVYPSTVCSFVNKLRPSARNELEITDLNNLFLTNHSMNSTELIETEWFDVGTPDSLLDASNKVKEYTKNKIYFGYPELSASSKYSSKVIERSFMYGNTEYHKVLMRNLHEVFED